MLRRLKVFGGHGFQCDISPKIILVQWLLPAAVALKFSWESSPKTKRHHRIFCTFECDLEELRAMAAAREGYFPEEADDRVGDRLLQNSDRQAFVEHRPSSRNRPRARSRSKSESSDSDFGNPGKPRKFVSFWVFSLIVIGVAVMFLLGVCLGFYVRELQTDKPDLRKICGVTEPKTKEAEMNDKLGGYHESLVYYIRAKGIRDFVE
ncbi:hypothetical protein PoB_007549300 [Plakobranchus ocellatus]|uniref:Uncharacterized protein n=1 Tax=Plakobranchus ocellatus TaxID=259542 RepID=A0AAV4DX85_9GAST|nr:hypothetical protein PoB_007549300 [Plakobranchus ocellatus]